MIPQQHRQESLHRAYVAAVAAQAGVKVNFGSGIEYGVDGTFRLVGEFVAANGVRLFREMGYPVDFQLKSTVGCRALKNDDTQFSFDCEVAAYNKIVLQNAQDAVPVLLIVFCLPSDNVAWVSVDEDALTLRKACYWKHILGDQTTNDSSEVVRISRSQLFTPDALTDIMSRVQSRNGKL